MGTLCRAEDVFNVKPSFPVRISSGFLIGGLVFLYIVSGPVAFYSA